MTIKPFVAYIRESYGAGATAQFQSLLHHCEVSRPNSVRNDYTPEDAFTLRHHADKIVDQLLHDDTLRPDVPLFPTRVVAEHLHTLDLNPDALSHFAEKMSLHDLQYLAHLTDLPDDYRAQLLSYVFQHVTYADQVFGHEFMNHLEALRCWFHTSSDLKIYRSLALPMDAAVLRKTMNSFDGIGRYWTYDRASATSYWNDRSRDEYVYLLEASVRVDDVDWVNTVFKNLYSLKHENEIYLNANATPKITQVWHGSSAISVKPTFVDAGTTGDY